MKPVSSGCADKANVSAISAKRNLSTDDNKVQAMNYAKVSPPIRQSASLAFLTTAIFVSSLNAIGDTAHVSVQADQPGHDIPF